jgi:hypothetical protein
MKAKVPVASVNPNSTLRPKHGQLSPQLAPGAESSPPLDPNLARVVAAWPGLPAHIRAAVLALLQSAGK